MRSFNRIIALMCCFVIILSIFSVAFAVSTDTREGIFNGNVVSNWMSDATSTGSFGSSGKVGSWSSGHYESNQFKRYYITPTESVQDAQGNVTNYYRGGDTTTTKIIDSYNQTFNTIHNTTNNTNNYSANVKLLDFLNSYTTNTNNYTYNTEYKSWYYDNTSNTFNYDASQTYYNTDNSRYYISIDNSTDEYYLVDVQYSPTFVTVNYNYYNTNNTTNYGDVTNVYYFELTDGRNSADLSADEVAGLDLGYDVTNYQLVTDDPNTLSLQHFDGDYTDSSSYARSFYSENRSTNYVDSGAFGQAVALAQGAAAGVTIPDLWSNENISIEFRTYTGSASNKFALYIGNMPVLSWQMYDGFRIANVNTNSYVKDADTAKSYLAQVPRLASGYSTQHTFSDGYSYSCGVYGTSQSPGYAAFYDDPTSPDGSSTFLVSYYSISSARAPIASWNSWKISIVGNTWYWFLNGDLLGSTTHDRLDSDLIQIFAQTGTSYLDELRVTCGDMVSIGSYTPSNSPYDTNKVLALPSVLAADTIYVRHSTPVTAWRIGGVRPSNPTTGFFYIPLHSDYTGRQAQLYDGSNWVDVDAMVSNGSTTQTTLGFTFHPIGNAEDVNTDLKVDDPDDISCSHSWAESSRTESTCSAAGSVKYICSKCEATKTEPLAKLNHSWEVKTSVQTSYDESGNVLTEGYTIYRCSVCGEEYKDTDGSGPPMSDTGEDSGSGWFSELMQKIGKFLGTTVGGFLELIGTAISNVLDSLISLVEMTIGKLAELIDLFGSFGDALRVLWTWLPEDVVTVLVAGVTVIIFVAVIKLFVR